MSSKVELTRPVLIEMYGFPGSGKTFTGRQLADDFGAAHIQADRIRFELFEEPRYDRQEFELINRLMEYMAEEFLRIGVSVVWDGNTARISGRRTLRDLAHKSKSQQLLVWPQVDIESAFARVVKRDHRRMDDKYARALDRSTFEQLIGQMQNPTPSEEYVVVSGKQTYLTQRTALLKKLRDLGVILPSVSTSTVRPEMVNRVPNPLAGRVDAARRNITIR